MNRRNYLRLQSLFAAGAVLALVATAMARPRNDDASRVKLGQKAPDFEVITLTGEPFSLEQHKGKVILLNFFATWCGPCIQEMPYLQRDVYEKLGKRDDFVVISLGREETARSVAAFQRQYRLTLPMAPDPDRKVYDLYAEGYIPRNVLIGKDGRVKATSVGFEHREFAALVKTIESELSEAYTSR